MNRAGVRERLALEWWLVLTSACAALALIVAFQITGRLDFLVYDFAQSRVSQAVDPSVLVVTVDNRSVERDGVWPWPRDQVARLVDRIGQAGPKAIGLDILLLEARDPVRDSTLAQSMRGGVPIYLPLQFDVPGQNGAQFAVTPPVELFRQQAAALGHVNIVPDRDGLIRRAYLAYSDGSRSWPSLAALMSGRVGPAKPSTGAPVSNEAQLVGRDPVLISFAGPAGSFPQVSASSVLNGEVPAELLHGRRILIGVTASGIGDVYATSVGVDGSLMPGVEIQANLLSTLLAHREVVPANPLTIFLLSLLPVLVVMFALRFLPPRWTLPLIVGLLVAVLGISVGVLRLTAFWLPPVSALTVVVLLYPVWMWRKLALASGYLSRELERAASSSAMLEVESKDDPPADVLDRQMHLLSRAVQRERDLGKFLNDRLSQMPDCVLVTNLEGLVVFANERAKKLFGTLNGAGDLQSADDLLNYLYCLKPSGRVPVRFSAVPRMHGIPWNCEAETVAGSCFDVRFQPQQNSAHELVGYVIRIIDNTDMVTTQRQRNDALELLSHDMRSPQSSIISYVDSLDRSEIDPEAANRIRAYAGHTLKLADDFVHLARAQTVEVVMTEVDLAGLVTEAAQSLWPQARAKQVSFAYDLADDGLWVRGDASLLSRMLGNLIDNAVKFAPAGSIVTLSCKLVADGPARWAAVAVANAGEGIAPARMETLYRRFQSTAPAGTYGVGLGLAFIHTVVVRHRGRIRCESVEGERTTFTVELPADVSSVGLAAVPRGE